MSGAGAPRLAGASARALGVAPIRLTLGAAAIATAIVRGLAPPAALGAAAAGGVLLTLIAVGQAGRAGRGGEQDALPVPPGARYDPGWQAVLLACVPSTLGVGLMAAAALVFSPALAAVLAGVLVAMGLLALVSGLQLTVRERVESVRYWLERGPRPRTFVSSEARVTRVDS